MRNFQVLETNYYLVLAKSVASNNTNTNNWSVLVIAWRRVQYGKYFTSFYFANLFHGPLGELNNSKT